MRGSSHGDIHLGLELHAGGSEVVGLVKRPQSSRQRPRMVVVAFVGILGLSNPAEHLNELGLGRIERAALGQGVRPLHRRQLLGRKSGRDRHVRHELGTAGRKGCPIRSHTRRHIAGWLARRLNRRLCGHFFGRRGWNRQNVVVSGNDLFVCS